MTNYLRFTILIFLSLSLVRCNQKEPDKWQEDFKYQPVSVRPSLEVNFTDSSRKTFQIMAQETRLTGQLVQPHLLIDSETEEPWLWMEMIDEAGRVYSTQNTEEPSRINIYRRGPYFCEVHWLDIGLTTADGKNAPMKGDLALYCYPEKILAEIKWHATGDFRAKSLQIKGIAPKEFECSEFIENTSRSFLFPLMGEEPPLSDEAFKLSKGEVPFRYDSRKGYYVVGTYTTGGFEGHFNHTPNMYETAKFTLTNDSVARKIYICHKTAGGGGYVEGGVVLNEEGQVMPILVQVSKNFASEKEEIFYNPRDTAFSETFFPVYLEPGETITLTSLHLYQNWGRHMTKHWSSLGGKMDYFHSSTGVTTTTCYVPFKVEGIDGVSIAELRAMSQETFLDMKSQHDNLAGHNFLAYYDGQKWQNLKYESTVYRSTGPNWYDIQLNYISTDGSIRASADIWETPQTDELRSFFRVRYEVLKPLMIDDPRENFRLLSITSAIQGLRFTRFAANGMPDLELDPALAPFPVKGHPLPAENAYLAEYGDSVNLRGSNAIIIRKFTGPGDITPAASMQLGHYLDRFKHDEAPNTRLLLVPDAEKLELNPGDVFEIDGYWLPYGPEYDAETPRRELEHYGAGSPKVFEIKRGALISDLPVWIKAEKNRAEFSIKGGKDLIPVIISGLTEWKNPRIWKKDKNQWHLLSHARNNEQDGYQVFCEEGGTFGAVFLVHGNEQAQQLKITIGKETVTEKIVLDAKTSEEITFVIDTVLFGGSEDRDMLALSYPGSHGSGDTIPVAGVAWIKSEGNSLWFHANEKTWWRGGRISPNEEDLDLEYWWQNHWEDMIHSEPRFTINLAGTGFEDPEGNRTWVLKQEGWEKADFHPEGSLTGTGVIAVQSSNGKKVLAMALPNARRVFIKDGTKVGVALEPVSFPVKRRYYIRGKIYLMEGDLDALEDRIRKEANIQTYKPR